MALTEEKKPYEYLVRFNPEGEIQGSHIIFMDVIKKDGVVINASQRPAESVAAAEAEGFPLSDVVGEVNAALIRENESLKATILEMAGQIESFIVAVQGSQNQPEIPV